MSIDETAGLLSGQMVRNEYGTFWFDQPGSWLLEDACPIWERLHREDGPAAVYANGTQEWWANGRLHRLDGPAVIYTNGTHEWWINGEFIKHGHR